MSTNDGPRQVPRPNPDPVATLKTALSLRAGSLLAFPAGAVLMAILERGWLSIGALAAAMLAPSAGLSGSLMLSPFLIASVAAVLGGLDSPVGAVVGGLLIGVVEAVIVGYVDFLGADMLMPVMLVILLGVLLLRPSGLFGSERVERV